MARVAPELLGGDGGLIDGRRRPGRKYAWRIPRPLLVSLHPGARAAGSDLGPVAFFWDWDDENARLEAFQLMLKHSSSSSPAKLVPRRRGAGDPVLS